MNNVVLVGRVARDIELRYTQGGIPVCFFTLAVSRSFKNKEGRREADFVHIKVWDKLADTVAAYVTKGSLISVNGRVVTGAYKEKGSEVMKYATEVVGESIGFLNLKKNEEEVSVPKANKEHSISDDSDFTIVHGDMLPFNNW